MASVTCRCYGWLTIVSLALCPVPPISASSVGHVRRAIADTVYVVHIVDDQKDAFPTHSRRRRADGEDLKPRKNEKELVEEVKEEVPLKPAIIEQLHVHSNITARFGVTEINCVMENDNGQDMEVTFKVQIPVEAFISNFTMTIDGVVHVGNVFEKEEADELFNEAKNNDETTGIVKSADTPEMVKRHGRELFEVKINIAAGKRGVFCLHYQQLLKRTLGIYTHAVSIDTPSLVKDLLVHVAVYEPQGFRYFSVEEPGSGTSDPQDSVIVPEGEYVYSTTYHPPIERQLQIMNLDGGINGEFLVNYDVTHELGAGLVFTEDAYFVHYFSPSGLQVLAKNVVFVIDISGSMSGLKLESTKTAMHGILDQLRPFDKFEIIIFSDDVRYWNNNGLLVLADSGNITAAKTFISKYMIAEGGTNINDALISACRLLANIGEKGQNLVYFLTDGRPTSGVVTTYIIIQNIKAHSAGKATVFSLGFGSNVNYELLKQISYETGGWVEHITDQQGSDSQMEHVYEQVNTPLLFGVQMLYDEEAVDLDTLTQTEFPTYFNGSELVVAGRLQRSAVDDWKFDVTCSNGDEEQIFSKHVEMTGIAIPLEAQKFYSPGFAERLWATARIRYLLEQHVITTGLEKHQIYTEALEIALSYKLVTSITSLVVTQSHNQKPSMSSAKPMGTDARSGNAIYSGNLKKAAILYTNGARGATGPARAGVSLSLMLSALALTSWRWHGME